jgi:hypothetical protein
MKGDIVQDDNRASGGKTIARRRKRIYKPSKESVCAYGVSIGLEGNEACAVRRTDPVESRIMVHGNMRTRAVSEGSDAVLKRNTEHGAW